MSFNIQLWGVENGQLVELPKERLDTEDRLEHWIAEDVSLLGLDLLIIGDRWGQVAHEVSERPIQEI